MRLTLRACGIRRMPNALLRMQYTLCRRPYATCPICPMPYAPAQVYAHTLAYGTRARMARMPARARMPAWRTCLHGTYECMRLPSLRLDAHARPHTHTYAGCSRACGNARVRMHAWHTCHCTHADIPTHTIHTCMHTHMPTYTIHICMHTDMHTLTHAHIHTHMHTCSAPERGEEGSIELIFDARLQRMLEQLYPRKLSARPRNHNRNALFRV